MVKSGENLLQDSGQRDTERMCESQCEEFLLSRKLKIHQLFMRLICALLFSITRESHSSRMVTYNAMSSTEC